jgi:hypothetical protein
MSEHIQNDLIAIEARLNAIPMSHSERVVAIGALHRGFVIVERFAWAAQAISRISTSLFARPVAAN